VTGVSVVGRLNPVPRNPLRALASPALWAGCAHLATDGVVGFAGIAVLLVLGIALCLVPMAFVGAPLVVAAVWMLLALASAERTRFAATCGITLPPLPYPQLPRSPFRALGVVLRSRETWRLSLYFLLLIPVAVGTFVGVALAWALPATLAFLPLYYDHLASGRAALGPLTISNAGSALVVSAVALLIGVLVSPLFVRSLLGLDLYMARRLLTLPPGEALTQRVEQLTESRARTVDAAEAAVSALEPLGPSVELARAYATFANQRMLYADYDVAIDLALRAQALATRFGATDVYSDALNTQAASRSSKGLDWAGQMREALDIALAGGHHHEAGRAYTNLSGIHAGKREFAEAERYLEPGIAFCDEHDITTFAICMRGEHANVLERTSRWDEAVALSTEILIKVGPSPANRICSLIRLGAIGARRGEPGVWAYLDEAAATADEAGEPQNQVPARLARAEAHWLAGEVDAARREAELALDVCTTPNGWLRGAVAVWLRRLASPHSLEGLEGEVTEPYRLLLDGDPVGAARAWTRLGSPYEAAMALADAPEEEALREALSIVIGLGAHSAAQIIRQRLRVLGARSIPVGPRAATRERPFGLTRREYEVLDLICAEHTNAEIAAKLFLSVKTVDHHVSAVLAKLGVPTRAAARRVVRSA